MTNRYSLFWSYVHEDNAQDRGRVLALAEHLRDELSIMSGVDVEVFVDRTSIEWGDKWRERIDDALDASVFFIPVLTPRYFTRDECRREMLTFYGQAESRGLGGLLLPLLYLPVAGLDTSSGDELVAVTARTQYESWVDLRLSDVDASPYRTAVNRLARRIIALAEEAREVERGHVDEIVANPGLVEPGILDLISELRPRFDQWLEKVLDDEVSRAMYEAVNSTYLERMRRAPRRQRLAIELRSVTELIPVVHTSLALAKEYSSLSIEMHPKMTSLLRMLRQQPNLLDEIRPFEDGVEQAYVHILETQEPDRVWAVDYYRERTNYGGAFKEIYGLLESENTYKNEGNALVAEWRVGIANLRRAELGDATPDNGT